MDFCYICKEDTYEVGHNIPRYICNYRVCSKCYFDIVKYINDKRRDTIGD